MVSIKVGNKRTASFTTVPLGPDGSNLPVTGIPTWSLGEAVSRNVPSQREASGATLAPSADGLTCDVIADAPNVTLALHCYADRGDGVLVHGGSLFETVGDVVTPPGTVITGLTLKFGEEVPVV